MRLIDADALCDGRVCNDPVVIAAKCAPTVDAVPVVRCKECQCWISDGVHIFGMCSNPNIGNVKIDTDFCSYGVRKGGAE